MKNNDVLVRLEQVSRRFAELTVLDNISLELKKGEVLGLLGPNGAGKSTTMQIISGNLAPSAGRVLIDGIDLLDRPKQAKALLGYLPDTPPLYPELRVDEFLLYCAGLNRIKAVRRPAAVALAKERCGLGEVGQRLIAHLSKGYRQRVGIAQAIIHSPAVVILDEPTVGLDPIQIREIRQLIRQLADDHSVILSTHILPEVEAVCDRVQIINKGRLVMNESIAGLQQRMRGESLQVALRQPPALSRLESLPGVASVAALGDGRFRFRAEALEGLAEMLVVEAVRHDWGLYELVPERLSLEQIFVDITATETQEVA